MTCNNRGEALFALGDYKRALADFQKSQTLNPDNLMTLAGMTVTLHALGNVEEAKQRCWQLLIQDENYKNVDWVQEILSWHTPLAEEANKLIDKL